MWKSWSATTMIEPCRSDDIDLCTESVSYTRMRTWSGSGSSCMSSSFGSFGSSSPACVLNAS